MQMRSCLWGSLTSRLNQRANYPFAILAITRFVAPLISGIFSPFWSRAKRVFSSACIRMASFAAISIRSGLSTNTPFSSASIASPGETVTPPHETGVQNSPPRSRCFVDNGRAARPDRHAKLAELAQVRNDTIQNDAAYHAELLGALS